MSVNTMTFEQSAAFLTDLYEEATGKQLTLQIANTADFTSVATSTLKLGRDPVMNALGQVLTKTIFSNRPYSQKFKSLQVDAEKWGAIVRKINYVDKDLNTTDNRMALVDGQSIDQYKVKKPEPLQMNFYGAHMYSDHITIFRDQLDNAFKDASSFGAFMAGVIQNIQDKLTQIKEAEARSILINMIATKASHDTANYINILQKYYDETGVTLTPATMFDTTNFTAFSRWLVGYIDTLMDNMSERSIDYHMNIATKPLMRHTPAQFMRRYISANIANQIDTAVASNLYNEEKITKILKGAERVVFWQNKQTPNSIKATPAYLDVSDGSVKTEATAVTVENIVACLFDEEAVGMTTMNEWSAPSPFNADGGYYNMFWHFTQRTWNDFTENFVVLYAGTVTP